MDALGFQIETKPTLEPWRQVLLDAADYIVEHGWCQHTAAEPDGRACISGAAHMSMGWTLDQSLSGEWGGRDADLIRIRAALRRFGDFVGGHNGVDDWQGTIDFNDTPGRTASEVIAALRECARS